jgi:hypothetical protein
MHNRALGVVVRMGFYYRNGCCHRPDLSHHTRRLRYGARFHHGFCRVRASLIGLWLVRCSFSDGKLHSRMLLVPTSARLKFLHACDHWHFPLGVLFLTGHLKIMSQH